MRRYRPFLVFNPHKGWGFYHNSGTSSLTTRSLGNRRKTMRKITGWFPTAGYAVLFERALRPHL